MHTLASVSHIATFIYIAMNKCDYSAASSYAYCEGTYSKLKFNKVKQSTTNACWGLQSMSQKANYDAENKGF